MWSGHSSPFTKHSCTSLFLEACTCSSLSTSCLPTSTLSPSHCFLCIPDPLYYTSTGCGCGPILEPCSLPSPSLASITCMGLPLLRMGPQLPLLPLLCQRQDPHELLSTHTPHTPGHSPRGCSEIPEVHLSDYAFSVPTCHSLRLTVPLFLGLHEACNQREVFPGQMKRKCIFIIRLLKHWFVFLSSPPVPFRRSFLRKRNKWSFQIRLCTLKCLGYSKLVVPDDPPGPLATSPSPTLRPHTPRSTPFSSSPWQWGNQLFPSEISAPNPYFANIHFSEKQPKIATAYNLASACMSLPALAVCITGHRERVQGIYWSPSWNFHWR